MELIDILLPYLKLSTLLFVVVLIGSYISYKRKVSKTILTENSGVNNLYNEAQPEEVIYYIIDDDDKEIEDKLKRVKKDSKKRTEHITGNVEAKYDSRSDDVVYKPRSKKVNRRFDKVNPSFQYQLNY